VAGGVLSFDWNYGNKIFSQETVQRVADDFVSSLRDIIDFCLVPENIGYTPSDFKLAKISQEVLDKTLNGRGEIDNLYPLSPMQEGMMFHTLYSPDSSVYFEQMSAELTGAFDSDAFVEAWNHVIQRHPILRTAFLHDGLERPLQCVHKEISLIVESHSWSDVDASQEDQVLDDFLETDRKRGFDLTSPGVMRLTFFTFSPERMRLVWSYHHMLLDGWSVPIVLGEVFQAYEAFIEGAQPTFGRNAPYADYIELIESRTADSEEVYWRDYLKGFEDPTAMVIKKSQPAVDPEEAEHIEEKFTLPEEVTRKLNEISKSHHVTLNTMIQGAWGLLLSRYTDEADVMFGATVSGRPAELNGVEQMVGLFINTLPVRMEIDDDCSVQEWLKQLQSRQLEQRDYESTPLVRIRAYSELGAGKPLFESIFVFENFPVSDALEKKDDTDATLAVGKVKSFEQTNFPLTVLVSPGKNIQIKFSYDNAMFDSVAIERMAGHMGNLLRQMAEDPSMSIGEVELLGKEEKVQVISGQNATDATYNQYAHIQSLFEDQVALTPERIALTVEGADVTYQSLNDMSNRLVGYLSSQGVKPGDLVGVCCSRSVDMLVSLLAVLKCEAAYVPIDPEYPKARIAYVIDHSKPSVILTQSSLREVLPETSDANVICLDVIQDDLSDYLPNNPTVVGSTADLAYVIYTSGSTGNPKGVAISQKAFHNFLFGMKRDVGIDQNDRLLAVTSLSFDIAGLELFLPLLNGARVVLATKEQSMDVAQLVQLIDEQDVSFLQATPATWHMLVNNEWKIDRPFKGLCGGEPLPIGLANSLLESGVMLTNVYGPTETTVWSSLYHLEQPLGNSVPIGKPIANTQCYVLDRKKRPVPVGVPGELYIGGHGLADGYLHSPDLTDERFVKSPFSSEQGDLIYQTGDLVRYLENGNLECLGRLDHQVKIRGFRIELGEIETVFNRFDAIKEGVIHPHEDGSGVKYLVAYYTVSEDSVNGADIRSYLKESLPDYMVPTAFVEMESMPLTPNGKVDRKALKPADTVVAGTEYVEPNTEVEKAIAEIWASVLKKDKVGIKDDFFEIGGHSLVATQIVSRVKEKYEVDFPLKVLFETTTIKGMADYIETVLWASNDSEGVDELEDDEDMEEFEI